MSKVACRSEKTKELREASTNEAGAISLGALPPDTYSLKVEHSGFKTFQRTGIVVTANERIALGDVALQIGAVSETVSVAAKSAHVETDSGEEAAEVTTDQIGNLTARGRDVVSLLRTIPGAGTPARPGCGP